MFTAILRRVLPAQAGPSTRACSSSSRCAHTPITSLRATPNSARTQLTAPSLSSTSSSSASPSSTATISRSFSLLSSRLPAMPALTTGRIGQLRGMKVRSSVKRFCDGCSVVRRYVSVVVHSIHLPWTLRQSRCPPALADQLQERSRVHRVFEEPKTQAGTNDHSSRRMNIR